ncbi:MAG TPA: hypothetical protein VG939_06020 [Caulobacteraceae bacterium]|nr:hypothetical protein [Caulobacteraceae bacterium]
MSTPTVRSLAELQKTASTSRVLNLLRVAARAGDEPEHRHHPFFRHPRLNRAIFLKHRLRRDELELFPAGRQTVTKIVIPMDGADLRLGGRSVFIDQMNYEAIMRATLGERWVNDLEDHELLRILDDLPSFDPFLLREQLKRHGRSPARCYFEISDGDLARMHRYVEGEIRRLIELCFADGQHTGREGAAAKLVRKILSITVDEDTEPLRLTLRLDKAEYQEGVFCWKGFLYYKWTVAETLKAVEAIASGILSMRPRGPVEPETRAELQRSRQYVAQALVKVRDAARETLRVYDRAYQGLVEGEPQGFREFLLGAPSMFSDLGERLGAVQHVVSFWNYRFPPGKPPFVGAQELFDILADFEDGLSFPELSGLAEPAQARRA